MRLKHLKTHMKTLEKAIAEHMQHPHKTIATCKETHLQRLSEKNRWNI
jgi:hypothetical protein